MFPHLDPNICSHHSMADTLRHIKVLNIFLGHLMELNKIYTRCEVISLLPVVCTWVLPQ